MDETQWHHVAEQRCKKMGCKYMSCLRSGKEQSECILLRRTFEQCKTDEMRKIKAVYLETGRQADITEIRRPDKLRDLYKGKQNTD